MTPQEWKEGAWTKIQADPAWVGRQLKKGSEKYAPLLWEVYQEHGQLPPVQVIRALPAAQRNRIIQGLQGILRQTAEKAIPEQKAQTEQELGKLAEQPKPQEFIPKTIPAESFALPVPSAEMREQLSAQSPVSN